MSDNTEQASTHADENGYMRHRISLRGSEGDVHVRLRTTDPNALRRIADAVGIDAKVTTMGEDGKYH